MPVTKSANEPGGASLHSPNQGYSISAGILPMELADNVKHGTLLVDTDRANPPDPLAHCPYPTGRQLGEPRTARIIPVKPKDGGAGGPPVIRQ